MELPALRDGTFPSPIDVDTPLAQAATADVVALAAHAIEHPPVESAGVRIPVASDVVTGRRAAAALERVMGRAFAADRIAPDLVPPGVRTLFGWLEREGHAVDPADLRRRYPQIAWTTFGDWAASCGV